MTFEKRVEGVFTSPQSTFPAIAEKPYWADVFVVLIVVGIIISFLIAPLLHRESVALYRDNIKLQERMGKENFEKWLAQQEHPSSARLLLRSLIATPLVSSLGFLVSAGFLLGLGSLLGSSSPPSASSPRKFVSVLAVYLHASLIDRVLGGALRLLLTLLKKSALQTTTSLAMFFPRLEIFSPAYLVLSQFDFFQLWMFGVLAYGLAAIFHVSLKKALAVSYGFWLLKSLLYIGLGLISRSFMG